ncbi:MAG: protein-L-isoaspartate O-methyltransferase [Flavobacteriaceae bacterium]|nr:protein-L-isoaspartate O-methyltransferase [Flavobacteriaceae bacterium]
MLRKDELKHQGMRNHLVAELKTKGITDENVLRAIAKVPRHLYLDSSFEAHAYQDKAFPIGANQTISQPYTVAIQSSLLDVKTGDKILEVGTGCGYQTAVLIALGAKVYTIERQLELFKKTKLFFQQMPYRPKKMIYGDGYIGCAGQAPFDGVIVTAGAPQLPQALLKQLRLGGRLVIPVGEGNTQLMHKYIKTATTKFSKSLHGEFRFVPLLEDKEGLN